MKNKNTLQRLSCFSDKLYYFKKTGLLFCCFIYVGSWTYAQSIPTPLHTYQSPDFIGLLDSSIYQQYPFIKFNKNHYQFYTENSPTFEHLFTKFRQLVYQKKGRLNFYQIGGSHIQADIYTQVVRQFTHNYWDGIPGARGLVFPFNLAGSNNPWNYQFTSNNHWTGYRSVRSRPDSVDYGLVGDAISCSDTYITLQFKYQQPKIETPITHIRLYHNKGIIPYRFYYQIDKGIVLKQNTNTEEGYTDTYFSNSVKSFIIHFIQKEDTILATLSHKSLFIYGLYLDNNLPGVAYSGIGANGADLDAYLNNPNFIQQLSDFPPDFFAIAIGTNDGNVPYHNFYPEIYKAKMDTLIRWVLKANADCAILLTVPNDAYFESKIPNPNIAREKKALIALAKKYQIPIWDLYGIMGGLGSSQTWYEYQLMRKRKIHFTTDGYRLYGKLYFAAFLKWLAQMENRKYPCLIKND